MVTAATAEAAMRYLIFLSLFNFIAASFENHNSIIIHKGKAVKLPLFIFVPGLEKKSGGEGKEYSRTNTAGRGCKSSGKYS